MFTCEFYWVTSWFYKHHNAAAVFEKSVTGPLYHCALSVCPLESTVWCCSSRSEWRAAGCSPGPPAGVSSALHLLDYRHGWYWCLHRCFIVALHPQVLCWSASGSSKVIMVYMKNNGERPLHNVLRNGWLNVYKACQCLETVTFIILVHNVTAALLKFDRFFRGDNCLHEKKTDNIT